MKNQIKTSILVFIFSSCKSNYTGFNAYTGRAPSNKPNTEQPKITKISKTEKIDKDITASVGTLNKSNIILQKLKSIEDSKAIIKSANTNNAFTKTVKVTFTEKVIAKIVQKQIKKANLNSTKPDGFSSLDGKLKIGLILLAVAIVLSIIGLGSLAGLAGLIGLIFLIVGLLNMYN